jgi:hypothetical protein
MAKAAIGVLSATFLSDCGVNPSEERQGLSNLDEYVDRCEGENDPDPYFPRHGFYSPT